MTDRCEAIHVGWAWLGKPAWMTCRTGNRYKMRTCPALW